MIVGGHGTKRTPALAARYADEFNIAFSAVDEVAAHIVDKIGVIAVSGGTPGCPPAQAC